jgi:hypothetical protein
VGSEMCIRDRNRGYDNWNTAYTTITNAVKFTYNQIEPQHGDLFTPGTYGAYTGTDEGANFAFDCIGYKEFSIPLFSFLGSLSQKFAPLHNGYTIRITLNNFTNAMAFVNNATGEDPTANESVLDWDAITISDVNFCCQVLELGPVAESMLLSSTQGQPLIVPSKAYRNFVGYLPAQTSSTKIDLNLNVASLTNILFVQRNKDNITSSTRKTLSSRIRNYLQNWYFQYGSSVLPQTSGINCRGKSGQDEDKKLVAFTEAYTELMKSRHNWSNMGADSVINPTNFSLDLDTDTLSTGTAKCYTLFANSTGPRGTFAGGLDLELVAGRSNDIVCGMNTNGMNTSIFLNYDPDKTSSIIDARIDVWAEYDSFINISPGIATTVSF